MKEIISKLIIITHITFIITTKALSLTYYISSDGNDKNSGLSQKKAWRTITKVNNEFAQFKPGDSILFRRGDSFKGSLMIGLSGLPDKKIIIGAYGTGPKPVITGFVNITEFQMIRKGVYYHNIPAISELNLVLFNNENTPVGRWPNSGWRTITAHTGKISITDSNLISGPDWTGAEIVVRTRTWVLERKRISNHKNNTFIYNTLYYEPENGNGYYIQNHPETLDTIGEWSFDGKTFMIFLGLKNNIKNHSIKYSEIDDLLIINNKSNLIIENIQFEGANKNGCNIKGADGVIIRNCTFVFNGINGISATDGCSHILVEKNFLSDNNNIGIYLSNDSHHCTIIKNKINKSGYLQGMGTNTDLAYSGIVCLGDYSLITYNKVENSGYIGIRWGGQNSEVSYNYINNTCLWKDDGGGIYTFNDESTGKVVKNNIVLNAKVNPSGWYYYDNDRAHGIYIDGSDNILVSENTLAYNEGAGLYINEARNIIVEGNTCFDNIYGIMITSMTGNTFARNLLIKNNIFHATRKDQFTLFYATKKGIDEVSLFGYSDKNFFLNNIFDHKSIIVWINAWNWTPGNKNFYSLKEWQLTFNKDINSKEFPDTIIEEYNKSPISDLNTSKRIARPFDAFYELDNFKFRFEFNITDDIKKIILDGIYIDEKGIKHSYMIDLLPLRSTILFRLKD